MDPMRQLLWGEPIVPTNRAGTRPVNDPAPRNLSLLRLGEADRRVRRRLALLRGRLARQGVDAGIAEGSAIAAELTMSEEGVRRRAIRVNLLVAAADLDRAETALRALRFRATRRAPTMELIRLANRSRYGAVHVVFDDALPPGGAGLAVSAPHPGSPEAQLERAERLSRYRLEPQRILLRTWSRQSWWGRREESVEIGLVVRE
jgi:hypothetical protein